MFSRSEDTLAGQIRAAVGAVPVDGVVLEARAMQIKTEAEVYHRANYGTRDWQLPDEMAREMAKTEARDWRPLFTGTTSEFAAILQRQLPWANIVVGPDADKAAARQSLGDQMARLDGRYF